MKNGGDFHTLAGFVIDKLGASLEAGDTLHGSRAIRGFGHGQRVWTSAGCPAVR